MTSFSKSSVALHFCEAYSEQLLIDSVDAVFSHLALPENLSGLHVMVKPNLISSRGPALACTHGAFLAAVIHWLNDNGAKVMVGDSPAFGTTQSVMEKQGMTKYLYRHSYTPVKFATPVAKRLSNGLSIEVAAEALDCDLFLNLPKLKAHNQMFITGAVKNIFGIVVGIRKAMLHMVHGSSHNEFADILIRLPELLPQHISMMDAVEVMHRSGPLDGDPLPLRCIGGSGCPVALDTSVLEMLEVARSRSPLWQAASALKVQGSNPDNITYPIDNPARYHGSGFETPQNLNPVRFNPLRFLLGSLKRLRLAIRE